MSERSDSEILESCYQKSKQITKSNWELIQLDREAQALMEQLDKATKPRYSELLLGELSKEKKLRFAGVI